MANAPRNFHDLDFALVYERAAERLTGPISIAALDLVGSIGAGVRLLDVAAGTGALSVPAAAAGASVLATDKAPGMVERLKQRLASYPLCEARIAEGEHLAVPDATLDAVFCIFGEHLFGEDWGQGLRELLRVLKPGGSGCVSMWRNPPGGGPFVLMNQALRSVFPTKPIPPTPNGMKLLSSPETLEAEMRAAGFGEVTVTAVNYEWRSLAGVAFLEDTKELYEYVKPYADLDEDDRAKVRSKLLDLLQAFTIEERVSLPSPALIAVGKRTVVSTDDEPLDLPERALLDAVRNSLILA